MIAALVCDREEHSRRLADPEGYRPPCRHCGRKMHAHGIRTRTLVGEAPIDIRRYACPKCGGAVQVLPGFVARHLRRTWKCVEDVLEETTRAERAVPARTRRRLRARAREPARPVLQVLSALREPALASVVGSIGLGATRRELLAAFRPRASVLGACATLAILANLVWPGLRMM